MPLFDVHVHLFPPRTFEAIWRWFDRHAWPIEYRMHADEIVTTLVAGGVERMVGLAYSHKEGMARSLNDFMRAVADRHRPHVVPFGTVLPGEPGWALELERVFGPLGMAGLKLHCHVQNMAPDDDKMLRIFEAVAKHDKVLLIHCGKEPSLEGYPNVPRELCSVDRFYEAMRRTPEAKVIVPHLGAGETPAYLDLLSQFPNLYLDTAMALGHLDHGHVHLDHPLDWSALSARADRILYGTDFPNLPYAWDTEVGVLRAKLAEAALGPVLWDNAARLFAGVP